MTNSKNTKRALLASVLSMMLCMAMLVGTTFAWFTDSVTSSGNKIQAGNLKIALDSLRTDGNYVDISNSTDPLFNQEALWEPGYSEAHVLRVRNEGNLALKYKMEIVVKNAASGVKLADVIDVYAYNPEGTTAINELPISFNEVKTEYNYVGTLSQLMAKETGIAYGYMKAGSAPEYYGFVFHMKEEAGNEYQGLSIGDSFDIVLKATQWTYENDSFGKDYDEKAPLDFIPVATADELISVVSSAVDGEPINVSLSNDISLDTLPLSALATNDITIQGNGNTISSDVTKSRPLRIEDVTSDKTLTIINANIKATSTTVNGSNDQRGISIFNSHNATINLIGCTISLAATDWSYAVNLTNNCSGLTINISNCQFTSANVINCHASNCTINIDNCVLTSNYGYNPYYHGVCIYNGNSSNVINVKNTIFNGTHAMPDRGGVYAYNDLGGNIDNTTIQQP